MTFVTYLCQERISMVPDLVYHCSGNSGAAESHVLAAFCRSMALISQCNAECQPVPC